MDPIHTSRGRDTVGSVLRQQAARHADEPFLVFEREPGVVEETTWAGQLDRAERTAGALHRLGVRQGGRFCVYLANCPDLLDLWLAAALLGAAIVPASPQSDPGGLAHSVKHSGAQLVMTSSDLGEAAQAAVGSARDVVAVDEPWIEDDDVAPMASVDPLEVLGVQYTTGTPSRGVLVTHAAYLAAGDAVAEHVRLHPSDRVLIVLPASHGSAPTYPVMSVLVTGASLALTHQFAAGSWSAQASGLGATVAGLMPGAAREILASPPARWDRSHALRLVLLPQGLDMGEMSEFEERFDVPMAQLLDGVEVVLPPAIGPVFGIRRRTSIGRPVRGVRVRLVDAGGSDVPPGETGELMVAGEPGRTLMLGYLDDPEATAAVMRDGWLRSGQRVRSDEDGFLYVPESVAPPPLTGASQRTLTGP